MNPELSEEFKIKHELWVDCLAGESRNSIRNQIYEMVWNAAVFKVINEARRISPINAEGYIEANGMIHEFIDKCFFDSS